MIFFLKISKYSVLRWKFGPKWSKYKKYEIFSLYRAMAKIRPIWKCNARKSTHREHEMTNSNGFGWKLGQ